MPALKKKPEINLIPLDKFSVGPLGKILNWLLSTFRVIVILVEMVVMVAFLSRFWLDAKNSDLNDEIKQKQAIIAASRNFEKEFNQTREKMTIWSSVATLSDFSGLLSVIPSYIPDDVYLKNIAYNLASIKLDGESPSEQSIAQLIANLEAANQYKSVNLTQIGSNEENGLITFKIDLGFKTKGEPKTK